MCLIQTITEKNAKNKIKGIEDKVHTQKKKKKKKALPRTQKTQTHACIVTQPPHKIECKIKRGRKNITIANSESGSMNGEVPCGSCPIP
jgi:hypothetical protein